MSNFKVLHTANKLTMIDKNEYLKTVGYSENKLSIKTLILRNILYKSK